MLQPQLRFSMDDLRGYRRTMDSLDQLWIRKDYRLSEPTLEEKLSKKPKTQQARKEEMLVKACQDLGIASIIFEFKSLDLVNDKSAIKAQGIKALTEQKNQLDLKMSLMVHREILRLLEKEALAIFEFEERMKAYRVLIAEMLRQDENEARFRTQGVPLTEKVRIEKELFDLRKEIHVASMAQLNNIFNQVNTLSKQYTAIVQTRQQNQTQHVQTMTHKINNFQVQGQPVFTPDQSTQLVQHYNEKNQLLNEIEDIDQEIVKKKSFVKKAKEQFAKVFSDRKKEEEALKEEASHGSLEQQQAAAEFISALEESSESEIEEFICTEELDHLHHDKDDLTASSMQEVDPEKKERIRKKIDEISQKELRLQERVAALKIKHDANIKKQQEKYNKLMDNSWNPAALLLRASKIKKLKMEEKELRAKIDQAETEITELSAKRQVLSEKLHKVVDSIESICDKAKNLVSRIFTSKKKLTGQSLDELKENVSKENLAQPAGPATAAAAAAAIDDLKQELDQNNENHRQRDNELAAQAAECAAQIESLVEQSDAVAAVGAGVDAEIYAVSPNSQHSAALAQFSNEEKDLNARTHAAAAAVLNMQAGISARVNNNSFDSYAP